MSAKYIVGPLRSSMMGAVGAVVFPEMCDHREMAEATMVNGEALSAGFVSIYPNSNGRGVDVELHGRSQSLKLSANLEHEGVVRRALGLHNNF